MEQTKTSIGWGGQNRQEWNNKREIIGEIDKGLRKAQVSSLENKRTAQGNDWSWSRINQSF